MRADLKDGELWFRYELDDGVVEDYRARDLDLETATTFIGWAETDDPTGRTVSAVVDQSALPDGLPPSEVLIYADGALTCRSTADVPSPQPVESWRGSRRVPWYLLRR